MEIDIGGDAYVLPLTTPVTLQAYIWVWDEKPGQLTLFRLFRMRLTAPCYVMRSHCSKLNVCVADSMSLS